MNINIYLEDSLGRYITQHSKQMGKSRNAIIREAIKEWIKHHGIKEWPNLILKFSGVKDIPSFESARSELLPPKEDPFE